jgi:hypothetical protein
MHIQPIIRCSLRRVEAIVDFANVFCEMLTDSWELSAIYANHSKLVDLNPVLG